MRIPTFIALCLLVPLAMAASRVQAAYQVEVIVFAHAAADSDGEQWLEDAGLPDASRFAALGAAADAGAAVVTPLPAANQRLNGVVGALRRSGRYRTLFHSSWLHPEGGRIRGVYITQPPAGSAPGAAAEILGSVRLRVTRFLHLDVDMAYFPPATDPDIAMTHVRLQESRKIKFNEVHYFDHPLFGVMVQVSRVGADDGTGDGDPAAPEAGPQ